MSGLGVIMPDGRCWSEHPWGALVLGRLSAVGPGAWGWRLGAVRRWNVRLAGPRDLARPTQCVPHSPASPSRHVHNSKRTIDPVKGGGVGWRKREGGAALVGLRVRHHPGCKVEPAPPALPRLTPPPQRINIATLQMFSCPRLASATCLVIERRARHSQKHQ